MKISEWTPGFVHAKVFVVDDREAVVGTINLDYRSLYHHFEDAVWLTDAPCIRDIEADFQATLEQCRTVENDPRSIWQGRWLFRALACCSKCWHRCCKKETKKRGCPRDTGSLVFA